MGSDKENILENKDIYIITGGILTEQLVNSFNLEDGFIIGVDRGAKWLIEHGIVPNYFVGDFDSVDKSFLDNIKHNFSEKIHVFPVEKDETDTELAVNLAVSLKPKQIILLGGIGTRLDHVLGNIHILLQAENNNIPAIMIGTNNRVQLILPNRQKKLSKSKFKYVSLLPFTEKVKGIKTRGFKYPLQQGIMEIGKPYGISNELVEPYGTIFIESGILIIIESKD